MTVFKMFFSVAAFVMGLLAGSFLNVCIYRLPRGESIAAPPSHCPSCGKTLSFGELIPVASFLWQRGRCRKCRAKISWRYPCVEFLTGLLFAVLYRHFGWPAFAWQAAFYSILAAVFWIDLEHLLIPNALVLALLFLAVVRRLLVRPASSLYDALAGALLGGGLFLLLAVLSKGGMGGGDIKLVAVLGLWFGWQQIVLLIFLAFVSGGILAVLLLLLRIKKRRDAVPFGPFLVLSALVVGMWGKQIIAWYLRFSGLS